MKRTIKFKGNDLSLAGRAIKIEKLAPDFRVVSQDLKEFGLFSFKDKIKVITTFPSLDTPVCDLQVKEFNKRAVEISSQVVVLGISKDLPFAQKRFCQANGIKSIALFSDYKYSSFGINYGLLIKELGLLARSIILIDKSDVLRYLQIVEELTTPPDYEDALKYLKKLIETPEELPYPGQSPNKCKPCEGGEPSLPKDKIEQLLMGLAGWQLIEGKKIVKEFKFKDFLEAKYFLDLIAIIAEEQGHHPTLTLVYNKLKITLTTHAAGGLTENDFIMAGIIDELGVA